MSESKMERKTPKQSGPYFFFLEFAESLRKDLIDAGVVLYTRAPELSDRCYSLAERVDVLCVAFENWDGATEDERRCDIAAFDGLRHSAEPLLATAGLKK